MGTIRYVPTSNSKSHYKSFKWSTFPTNAFLLTEMYILRFNAKINLYCSNLALLLKGVYVFIKAEDLNFLDTISSKVRQKH